jgi:membrane peptidoglycan carboxypeptidase
MRCARCGHENPPRTRFCRSCGRRLDAAQKTPRRRVRWGRLFFLLVVLVVVAGGAFAAVEVYQAAVTLPDPTLLMTNGFQDSFVYDRYGDKVATLHGAENRIDVPYRAIAPVMRTAIVDIEDHSFWQNPGFDLKSIVRAALADLRSGSAVQGASTITEQLAKQLYLKDNGTLRYKIQEFLLGLKLAQIYSKRQILDMYLNTVYFGDGAFGIGAAANVYFDERPSQLTLAQASLLAGLPQAPSLYDPYVNFKLAKARQWQVLQAMVRYGAITERQAIAAYHTRLVLKAGPTNNATEPYPYPWFIDMVIQALHDQYHFSYQEIYNGGLRIYTTLDPTVYNIAQAAVTRWMSINFPQDAGQTIPQHQAAVEVMDPTTGYVLAAIGGTNPIQAYQWDTNYLFQPRSTGSSIKPIMEYTPALTKGFTEMSVIQDVPVFHVNGQWWPQNDDLHYRGYIDLRDALAISDNDVAVKLLDAIGLQYGFDFATHKFGLNLPASDLTENGLGMAIGEFAHAPTAWQMTDAYDAIANGGIRMSPILITRVVNPNGAVLVDNVPHGVREFSPQVAYIMTDMMERVFYNGSLPGLTQETHFPEDPTGLGLYPGRPAAGKTGTNNNQADAWFDGFTPQLLVVVWEGRQQEDTNVPQITARGPAYGSVAAGPIWQQIIEQASAALHLPVENFREPPGIVTVPDVSITSGDLAGPNTPPWAIQSGNFIAGTEPTAVDTSWVQEPVLAQNPHVLWEPGCGPEVLGDFLVPDTQWHAGVPVPLDHIWWPPTKTCTGAPPTSPPPPGGPQNGAPTTPGTTGLTGTTGTPLPPGGLPTGPGGTTPPPGQGPNMPPSPGTGTVSEPGGAPGGGGKPHP